MATEYIDPNGNVNTLWWKNAVNLIDDAIRQPNVPAPIDDFSCLYAEDQDDNESQEHSFPSMVETGTITEIKLWHYAAWAVGQGAVPNWWVRLYFNGSWQAETQYGTPGSAAWRSITYSGLSLDPSDLDDLVVRWRSPQIDAPKLSDWIKVYAAYVEVTYSPGVAGVAKVYGIESGSIAKKYGTNWSDIAKIYGIT